MKQPDYPKELLLLALLLAPMVYLGIIWNTLPTIIPTNFNVQGTPDRVGGKSEVLLLMIFLFFTNALLYFLFRYIPKTEGEPGPEAAMHQREYYRIRFMIHIYLSLFTGGIIFMLSQGREVVMERWAFIGVGVLIAVIGLYLKKLQPNNYVGVRTPWTLQSTAIWKETHRMAGTLWLSTGIVIILASFFLPLVTGVFVLIFVAFILAALPYIYSFRLYNTDKG